MKKIIVLSFIALSVISLSTNAFPGTIQLPRTGQTKCYDTSGTEINCSGTGQDGDIQAGVAWPSPRFFDNGDGTITDNLTGLMWTQNANPAGNNMTWQSALDYVKTLNTGGHTDWRLPNVNELKSLVNADEPETAVWLNRQGFTNVEGGKYWSSTTLAYGTILAWSVHWGFGYEDQYGFKSNTLSTAWPVRAGLGTTIPSDGRLCVAESIYGENSEQTELLRKYRDNVLSKTPEGQETIKTYYKISPTINKLLEQMPLLKNKAKAYIDSMLPGIRKKVEESNQNP